MSMQCTRHNPALAARSGATPDVAAGRERASRRLAGYLVAVAAQDKQAFRLLYDATSAHLLGVAFNLLHNRARAEEALQDAYVRVWQNAASFDPEVSRPMTWLISIVRNRAIDLLRAERIERSTTCEPDDGDLANVAALEPLPEQQLLRSLQAAQIERGLRSLSREQRHALAMVLFRGMTHAEIAHAANVPLPTAKSWVRRGLAKLKDCLAESAEREFGDSSPIS